MSVDKIDTSKLEKLKQLYESHFNCFSETIYCCRCKTKAYVYSKGFDCVFECKKCNFKVTIGKQAYEESKIIAKHINKYVMEMKK